MLPTVHATGFRRLQRVVCALGTLSVIVVVLVPATILAQSWYYAGPNRGEVRHLLTKVPGWKCPTTTTDPNFITPKVSLLSSSTRDTYVAEAVTYAFVAECRTRTGLTDVAVQNAASMHSALRNASSLCSNAPNVPGRGAPQTLFIWGCPAPSVAAFDAMPAMSAQAAPTPGQSLTPATGGGGAAPVPIVGTGPEADVGRAAQALTPLAAEIGAKIGAAQAEASRLNAERTNDVTRDIQAALNPLLPGLSLDQRAKAQFAMRDAIARWGDGRWDDPKPWAALIGFCPQSIFCNARYAEALLFARDIPGADVYYGRALELASLQGFVVGRDPGLRVCTLAMWHWAHGRMAEAVQLITTACAMFQGSLDLIRRGKNLSTCTRVLSMGGFGGMRDRCFEAGPSIKHKPGQAIAPPEPIAAVADGPAAVTTSTPSQTLPAEAGAGRTAASIDPVSLLQEYVSKEDYLGAMPAVEELARSGAPAQKEAGGIVLLSAAHRLITDSTRKRDASMALVLLEPARRLLPSNSANATNAALTEAIARALRVHALISTTFATHSCTSAQVMGEHVRAGLSAVAAVKADAANSATFAASAETWYRFLNAVQPQVAAMLSNYCPPGGSDVRRLPAVGSTPDPTEVRTYEWPAKDAARTLNVQLGGTSFGPDIVMNGPPYAAANDIVEYDVGIPADYTFRLEALVAAAEARPVTVSVNGVVVATNAFAGTTASWNQAAARWMSGGDIKLHKGINVIRFERQPYFPHLVTVRITPIAP